MANTTVKKNATGYGYQYTDIAEIHGWLESMGYTYYQYIEPFEGNDYIYTVPIINGEEKPPRRGCRVIVASLSGKSNPAQEQGSGITYARRYSLLMAFGLATSDDDAQCMTKEEEPNAEPKKPKTLKQEQMKAIENKLISETKRTALIKRCKEDNVDPFIIPQKCGRPDMESLTEKDFAWILQNWTAEFVNGN